MKTIEKSAYPSRFLARIRAFFRGEDGIVYIGHRGDCVCCESCGVGIVLHSGHFLCCIRVACVLNFDCFPIGRGLFFNAASIEKARM